MPIVRRDPERLKKLRTAIRYLLREDALARGHQTRLAEHFSVSRQRVHQVVNEEQVRQERAIRARAQAASVLFRNGSVPPPAPAPQPPSMQA